MNKFITYEGIPIKSGGAHKVNKHSGIETYNSLNEFINNLTDGFNSRSTIELIVSKKLSGKKAGILYMIKRFGLPSINFNQFLSSGDIILKWSIKNINSCFEIIDTYINIKASVLWRFKFVDPDTKVQLPGQYNIPVVDARLHNSQIVYSLNHDNKTVSLWLALPFAELNLEAINYINIIKENLPFRLSESNWRIWTISNNKISKRKLSVYN